MARAARTPAAVKQPAGQGAQVAYFSMEIALEPDIPTYSGGLGVLAGDHLRSAADLRLPMIGVTLLSRAGYFRQQIVDGAQVESADPWQPERFARRLDAKVRVRIGQRDVWIVAWEYVVRSPGCTDDEGVRVLLLDAGLPENDDGDRGLTDRLYGGDEGYRLRQELVLGVGGVRMLAALGIEVATYHLNEGHAAFLALELLRVRRARGDHETMRDSAAAVAARCVFTTHTPVPSGHDQFDYALARDLLGELWDEPVLKEFAGAERLNMTRLALNLSGWVNGVARRHAETSRAMFPGYEVHAITNGVHPWTWASDAHRALYTRHIPRWCREPELLMQVDRIPDPEFAGAHAAAKADLAACVAQACPGARLSADCFTIGFARRMTAYKRPDLLFTDMERLRRIARLFPLQVVLAGKAHPRDTEGKRQIEKLHAVARELAGTLPVVFLPDYGMRLARLLVAGVDLWLNTPQRPLEASGTSGMKAALNGVPSLSVLDGWWIEGWEEGITGWAIGTDGGDQEAHRHATSLYDKLEQTVLPTFYEQGPVWSMIMKSAIARNGSYFNSHRMLRRYVSEAYWN